MKSYPNKQAFNLKEIVRNKSKRNAWWQHAPYHNNFKKKNDE